MNQYQHGFKLLILAMAVLAAIGASVSAFPATPTELDLNLLNMDSTNIDTSLLLTIDYTDGDGNPQSMNSVDDAGDGTLGTIFWGLFGGISNLYSEVPGKDGTDINITIDGYEPLTVIADEGGNVTGTYNLAQVGRTDEFYVVMAAAIATNGAQTGTQTAALKTAIDANDGTTPLVLDVRGYSEYSAGHIPGAIHIYYRDLGKDSALNYLDSALLAHDSAYGNRDIVAYGNTRHLSRMVPTYLKTQGYTARALVKGFSEWTSSAPGRFVDCTSFDTNGRGTSPAGCTSNNFPTTTTGAVDVDTQSGEGYPTIDCIAGAATSSDLAAITRCMYDVRYGDLSKPEFRVSAGELYDLLNDADSTNDPYVLSNRGTTWTSPYPDGPYYTAGHIPGAVAVDWASTAYTLVRQDLRVLNQTDFMPTDRTVVHHCWVGVSQQFGAVWYNLLGYTVQSLDFGVQGWTTDSAVRGAVSDIVVTPKNYAYDTTPSLSSLTTDKSIYGVGETVLVTWSATAAPTPPNYVMVEFYNIDDATTEELQAFSPSTTSTTHVVGATEDNNQIRVYVYYSDDASDLHGDPGTSDVVSTTVPYEIPEFPFPAILFGMFIPIYFSMRRHFLEMAR